MTSSNRISTNIRDIEDGNELLRAELSAIENENSVIEDGNELLRAEISAIDEKELLLADLSEMEEENELLWAKLSANEDNSRAMKLLASARGYELFRAKFSAMEEENRAMKESLRVDRELIRAEIEEIFSAIRSLKFGQP